MTVAQLIKELQKMPQDSIVILQKDAEGNNFSPLRGADDTAIYVKENNYSGEVYDTK